MKKTIFFLSLFFFFFFNISLTFGYYEEENKCLELLHEKIKNDNRFTNNDTSNIFPNGLKNVLYNETNNSRINLDNYNDFQNYLVKNPIHKGIIKNQRERNGFTEYDFLSRRTNIATIITQNNFNISNWVGFGRKSNFTFPLKTKTEPQEGDKWSITPSDPFNEFVIYTHHNYMGEFMSCGIFKVTPLGENTDGEPRKFSEISESGYFTNILNGIDNQENLGGNKCNSGFEGEKISSGNMNFYQMKTNVCVLNYAEKDYLSMHILAIAYDNDSEYLNEYIAFPLQVKAMKDLGYNPEGGLVGIRNKYLDFLDQNTCFKLIHNNRSDLPSFCNREYSSDVDINGLYSYEKSNSHLIVNINNIRDFIFPTTYAARELKNMDNLIEESRGMTIFENFPYYQYKKILEIKDENLRQYLLVALNPKFEDFIKYKNENGIILTPFEYLFEKCDINYQERSDIVIDLLNQYDDINKIDYKNISYKNKRFGDCIIPYPDKENIGKEIDLSFDSNKMLAQKIKGTYIDIPLSPEMEQYAKEMYEITNKYNETLNEVSNKLNKNEISLEEYNKLLKTTKETYEIDIKEFNKKYENIDFNNLLNDSIKSTGMDVNSNKKNNNLIIYYILLGLGILFIIIALISKSKKKI